MKTTLIFVRHGESNANGNGMFAGHLDIELSDRGLLQAESTANYIKKNYHVKRSAKSLLYCSSHRTGLWIGN